LYLRFI